MTTRFNVVVLASGLPVTVIGQVPVGVDALVVIVRVIVQVGAQDVGAEVAVAPVGSPVVLRLTAWGVPLLSVAVTVVEPDAPCVTVIFPELASV